MNQNLLDTNNDDGWCELGTALRLNKHPQAAIEAYLQCCHHGNPVANGCWQAGQTADILGQIESAINYYRFSKWNRALSRANELEDQLTRKSQP